MTLLRLDHVQLAMPEGEEDRARAFYRDGLGLNEVAKPAHLAARGGCWFEHGDLRVHLGIDPCFHPAQKAHPAFVVAGLDRLCAHLSGLGHVLVNDQPLAGYRRIYVHDPFGNRIELMEPADTG